MKYVEVRDTIKSGSLLAWSHRWWRTWYDIKVQFVRMFTRSEYSHVGVAWVTGGRVFVLEAVEPKVRIHPLSSLGSFYLIRDYIPWSNEVEEAALAEIGEEYSQLEAMANSMSRSINDKWQCAKYVWYIAELAGRKLYGKKTPSNVVQNALLDGYAIEFIENKDNI